MQKRNVLNSPKLLELKKKKRKILIRKIILVLLGVLIILIGLSFLSKIKKLNISEVEISGNKVIDTEAIKEAVDRELYSKYLWLFPKTNLFLYPKTKIKNKLAEQFKRLKDINISIENRKTLTIKVTERIPEYTWCGTTPPLDNLNNLRESCYFLDKEGFIFDEAPYFSGEVYFKFYGRVDLDADGNPAGIYLAKGYFSKIISFKDLLKEMDLSPAVIYIQDGEDIKVFLSKTKASLMGPELLFKKDADFARVAENLKAAISTEPLKSKLKNEYYNLEYIDLRFGNKVYYKFK